MTKIGKQIKEKREQANKSQKEFAEELTIAQPLLSRIENGHPVALSIQKLEFVCDYLEIEHTKKELKALKEGDTPVKQPKPTKKSTPKAGTNNDKLLSKLKRKYHKNLDISTKLLIAANVYQEVIELVEELEE